MIELYRVSWYESMEDLKDILKNGIEIKEMEHAGVGRYRIIGNKMRNFRTGRKPYLDKDEIRRLSESGLKHREIAEKMHCSRGYVTKVLNEKDIEKKSDHEDVLDEETRKELRELLKQSMMQDNSW